MNGWRRAPTLSPQEARIDRAGLITTVAAVLVMVTGGSSAATHSSQSGSDAIDVCALLPREEASKILGDTVRARPTKRSDSTSPWPRDDVATIRANSIALAKAIVGKLKG